MIRNVTLLVLCILTIGACTRKYSPYRIAVLTLDTASLDPIKVMGYNQLTLLSQICGRLTSVDEALNIEGDLAGNWEISRDRRIYDFTIKDGRHFADGSLVKIDDVIFTLRRAAKRGDSAASEWMAEVTSITKVNERKMRIILYSGDPRFLFKLSHPRFCVLNQNNPFVKIDGLLAPNSAGAYAITGFDPSASELSLKVTADFRNRAIEPEIRVQSLGQTEAMLRFAAGRLNDISFYLIEEPDHRRLERDSQVLEARLYWTWLLWLNVKRPHFSSVERRRFFSSNFDRRSFLRNWGSVVLSSNSIIPYGMRGYSEPPTQPVERFQRTAGRSCRLKTIGIDGVPLQLTLKDAIAKEVERLTGCKSEIKFLPMAQFAKAKMSNAADIYFSGLNADSNDPLGYFRSFVSRSGENVMRYSSAAFDETFDFVYAIPQEQRTQDDYDKVHAVFRQSAFVVPIGFPKFKFFYSNDVKSVHMNPLGMHLNRWWKIGRGG